MGILDKVKKKMKEQDERNARADHSTGDRSRNKVKGDNIYGDKQAEKEGSNQGQKTPRERQRRENFERQNGRKP